MKYQPKYIDQLDNQIIDGELINEYQIFGLKPVMNKNWMFVRWTLGLNIGNGRHIKHWSLTVFEVEDLNLNYLNPTAEGIDVGGRTHQPIAARRDSAAAKVEVFLDQLVAGQAQFRPLPGSLSGYLRENGKYRLNRAGLARAIELIQAKHKADSAAGKLQPPAQQGPVQPAPGGPPVTPPPAQEPPKN